jgi:hypothetical protein
MVGGRKIGRGTVGIESVRESEIGRGRVCLHLRPDMSTVSLRICSLRPRASNRSRRRHRARFLRSSTIITYIDMCFIDTRSLKLRRRH